ncbi:hypothetical protein GCM10017044_09870 [Kordiimonas sediminis]|uniref:Glycosyl hydrolase n=1 Tax=Kordiimonas sediminis TaxID=1735581 RepID=A0A919AP96_9PROT|nr:glycosyl hydrolase [Kordiimonas sediminis]GHF17514.1 hypothetical protein GCM10017044_09870 [Kordiimonas sediminis]
MKSTFIRSALMTSALVLSASHLGGFAASAADSNPFTNLKPREIGPAHTSGRISDFAFHPEKSNIFYVATSSGGVWKTLDNGISWTPIFDTYGSYATGVIEMDPNDTNTLWLGTGENNAQRSVANGDGVYKSIDGGKSWTNMGLKDSGHIGQIWINPDDSNHVLVAAQGNLWDKGGDRGLYSTTDGGKSWTRILEIDDHTGINEFVVDPNDPDTIVASSYQRRRHVWTLINGGPGSGIQRTTDGGKTWTKITSGLPGGDLGRIGLAAAPSEPGLIYAIIEADEKGRGVYATTDFGVSWEKRSAHMTTSPQYYNELFVDPKDGNTLYSTDTFTNVSKDGGRTWSALNFSSRHVDDHAMWIDPDNTDHMYIGGDGGVYETYDGGNKWRHIRNLPLAQFYRITPDNAEPFYNVCGGTQDNNSLCGPSRTNVVHGITNSDWHIILGGDGYKAVSDPTNPDIVYTQYQYGGLARYDKKTKERLYITPQPKSGENQYKWNWNTPIIISPHKSTRIYYGAEKLFVSEDRGDTWSAVSPDLTRQIDRNALDVMDRVWSVDAIAKNDSTSIYGSIIGLSESPLREGLIYVGTDDGLIQVTEDGGQNWRKTDKFKGVPDMSLIEDVIASVHDENVAYSVIDNHKRGDFKPYVLKTTDKGKSWKMISGDLPVRGTAHTIAEDHANPNLLFVGTEYGLFFTQNGGENWHQVKGGFPTIAVRDLEIQRRENDLVIGTFGRGVFILDDYSPLRISAEDVTKENATLFPVKDAWQFIVGDKWGMTEKGSLGDQFWRAENPPYGAIFTYHLTEGLQTDKAARQKADQAAQKEGKDTPYPDFDTLRAEAREEAPSVLLTVRDSAGNVVRKLNGKSGKGLHRTAWDLRYDAPDAVNLSPRPRLPWEGDVIGPMALPGTYTVTLSTRIKGTLTQVGDPQSFTVKTLPLSDEITEDRAALLDFQTKTSDLQRAVIAASRAVRDFGTRISHLDTAILRTAAATEDDAQRLRNIKSAVADLSVALSGDRAIASINEPTPLSIQGRIGWIIFASWGSQSPVSGSHRESYEIAASEFTKAQADLQAIARDLAALEAELESKGAPATPGRIPDWQEQ